VHPQQIGTESIPLMEPSACRGYMLFNRRFGEVLRIRQFRHAKLLAAVSAVGLLLTPAFAAPGDKKRPAAVSLTFDPLTSFTPAAADPKLAASFSGRGPSLVDLPFTPAAAKGRPSQVRVAIRAPAGSGARGAVASAANGTAASPLNALTPTTYKLGMSVGWRRFALAGDVAKSGAATPALDPRETAVVGVSYSLNRKLTGRVAVGAERNGTPAVQALRPADNYSLDVGGSYNITRNIAVTGGVRYRVEHDRRAPIADDRRDSQAVYVGTAFKF
jgi:hypothetical protein